MHRSVPLLPALARALLVVALAATTGLGARAADADCPPVATIPTSQELAAARAAARDRGFLWRIERDGRRSWLYGTVHVARLAWALPGPQLSAALREARVLALEIDLTDPGLTQQLREPAPAEEPLPAPLRERLARHIAAECLPPGALDNLPVMLQAAALGALAGRRDGLDPAYAIDAMLAAFGHAAGKRVVALENLDLQLLALRGDGPDGVRRFVEQTLDELDSDRTRPMLRRIAQVWADSDLGALESYPEWCDCMGSEADRLLMKRLLDERNLAMVERIDALHQEAGPILVGVGSLHFIGPQGLPALLSARGYRVERVTFAR